MGFGRCVLGLVGLFRTGRFGIRYHRGDGTGGGLTSVRREVFPAPLGPTRRKVGRVVEVVER